MFLTGAQLGGILGNSPHKLFVDGPEMHVEVSQEEMISMAQSAQEVVEAQQAAANHNVALEQALAEFEDEDTTASREALVGAFLGGFCRLPVATEADKDIPVVVLRLGDPNQPETVQEVPLLTDQELLLAFSGEEALGTWSSSERKRHRAARPDGRAIDLPNRRRRRRDQQGRRTLRDIESRSEPTRRRLETLTPVPSPAPAEAWERGVQMSRPKRCCARGVSVVWAIRFLSTATASHCWHVQIAGD